jgi:hypothetical protein
MYLYLKYICICNPLRHGGRKGAIQARSKRKCRAWEWGKTDARVGMGNGTKAEGVRGTRGRRKGEMHASGGTCERGKGGRDCVTHGTRGHGRGAGRERDACGHERGAGREKDRDACQRGRAKSKG